MPRCYGNGRGIAAEIRFLAAVRQRAARLLLSLRDDGAANAEHLDSRRVRIVGFTSRLRSVVAATDAERAHSAAQRERGRVIIPLARARHDAAGDGPREIKPQFPERDAQAVNNLRHAPLATAMYERAYK